MHGAPSHQNFNDAFWRAVPATVTPVTADMAIVEVQYHNPFSVGDHMEVANWWSYGYSIYCEVLEVDGKSCTVQRVANNTSDVDFSTGYYILQTIDGVISERISESDCRLSSLICAGRADYRFNNRFREKAKMTWGEYSRTGLLSCSTTIAEGNPIRFAGGSGDALPVVGTAVKIVVQCRCQAIIARSPISGPWNVESGAWSIGRVHDPAVRHSTFTISSTGLWTSDADAKVSLRTRLFGASRCATATLTQLPGGSWRIHLGDYYLEQTQGTGINCGEALVSLYGPDGFIRGISVPVATMDAHYDTWRNAELYGPNAWGCPTLGLAIWQEEGDNIANLSLVAQQPLAATEPWGEYEYRQWAGVRLAGVAADTLANGTIALGASPGVAITGAEMGVLNFTVQNIGGVGCPSLPRRCDYVFRDDVPDIIRLTIRGFVDVTTDHVYTDPGTGLQKTGRVTYKLSESMNKPITVKFGSYTSTRFELFYGYTWIAYDYFAGNGGDPIEGTCTKEWRPGATLTLRIKDARYQAVVELAVAATSWTGVDADGNPFASLGGSSTSPTTCNLRLIADLGAVEDGRINLRERGTITLSTLDPDSYLYECASDWRVAEAGAASVVAEPIFDPPIIWTRCGRWTVDKPFPEEIAITISGAGRLEIIDPGSVEHGSDLSGSDWSGLNGTYILRNQSISSCSWRYGGPSSDGSLSIGFVLTITQSTLTLRMEERVHIVWCGAYDAIVADLGSCPLAFFGGYYSYKPMQSTQDRTVGIADGFGSATATAVPAT